MKGTPLDSWVSRKLDAAEGLSISRLQEYQLNKLRETLEHVISHSRFYSAHLRGIDPVSVRSIEDISRLPLTYPGMLVDCFDDFLCVSPKDISRIVTLSTSGTTGRSKRVAFTPEDQELTIDFFNYGMRTFADSSDRVIVFLPGSTEGSVGDLLKKALSRIGCESKIYGPINNLEPALNALLDEKATCVVGIPSQLLALSRHPKSTSAVERIRLKSVLLSTDYVPQAVVDSLMQTWGCNVYGHYGMTEMGLGGAVECCARAGYHMRDADLLFEIIDPITGKPAKNGEYGEVVFSTITRRGMPLIRYRTGDRSRFLTQPCPCGSILGRMERISGRISEAIRLDGGLSISITQLDEIILRDPRVSAYSAEIHQKNGCDCLVLTLRSTQSAFDAGKLKRDLCNLSIGVLVRQGCLKLDIREGDPGYFTTGTAKRFIAERRN